MFRQAMKGEPGRNKETDNNVISLDTPQGTSKAYTCERLSKVAADCRRGGVQSALRQSGYK